MTIEELDAKVFSENLNTKFRAAVHGRTVELELIAVTELNYSPLQEAFSILFRGALDAPLPQGLFDIEHDRLGSFAIFMTPVARQQDGFHYEACFNRLRK
ncbi:MAG: hypothetical protein AB1631_31610 [Acidobacteriota bacterium]